MDGKELEEHVDGEDSTAANTATCGGVKLDGAAGRLPATSSVFSMATDTQLGSVVYDARSTHIRRVAVVGSTAPALHMFKERLN